MHRWPINEGGVARALPKAKFPLQPLQPLPPLLPPPPPATTTTAAAAPGGGGGAPAATAAAAGSAAAGVARAPGGEADDAHIRQLFMNLKEAEQQKGGS
jgi:hypothetical protein